MRFAGRNAVQLLLGALVAAVLLSVGPTAPAARLGAAINYTYRMVIPGIASDSSADTPPTGSVCGGATAAITALDKVGEVVTLSATGDLTGWKVISLTGNQTFEFPAGFAGSGVVRVKSGTPLFLNTASDLWWSPANIWLNTGDDDAALVDCQGKTVQIFDDGQ
jgi:hypothetical protein